MNWGSLPQPMSFVSASPQFNLIIKYSNKKSKKRQKSLTPFANIDVAFVLNTNNTHNRILPN